MTRSYKWTYVASDSSKIWPPETAKFASLENEILSWVYLQEFYRIWVVEVSKAKSMNKYLGS